MKKRLINIELIRVIAIIMVIIIHVSNIYFYSFNKISSYNFLYSVIYNSFARVCVPLFFMISGIFLINSEYSLKKYFKRIGKYILLLIIWSFIYYLINNNFHFNNFGFVLINSLFNASMTSRHLWFLYAIIGIYIALPFIQNMCKNLNREHENLFLILWITFSGLIVVIVPISRFITNSNIDISYPIPIINATYYLGYFISGHILYKRFNEIKSTKKINLMLLIMFLISSFITILITYYVSITTNTIFDSMTWYRSIFIIMASFAFFGMVVINKDKIKSEFILKLSKYSFGIYLIHMIFLNILKDNYDLLQFNSFLAIFSVTFIIYFISLVSCVIIGKIPILKKIIF